MSYEARPSDTCKWIICQKIDRDLILNRWGSIINFIIEYINNDNYVHTMINYFYVPVSPRFNRAHLHHDILIYGYNLIEKVFYVSDFFHKGKYGFEEISFCDFEKAYLLNNLTTNLDYLNNLVYCYSINKKCDYKFNINNITYSIGAYLNATVSEYWLMYNSDNKSNIAFGYEIYASLRNYIAKQMYHKAFIDIRPFYLLYDHKKIMTLRIKYLYKKGFFVENYHKNIDHFYNIEKQTEAIINLLIKYNMLKTDELIKKIVVLLNSIEIKEQEILNQYTYLK